MKLRTLRLQGFKSFADRTEVQFHDGITAIVGPNGCGKSNISDAIRWVLGEQRPTAIRGARMEEAIFQGSVNRRPVNRGSVALGVSNEDGTLPVPFEEVEIGRTVYRDGGSEYTLNRAACRLRDIHDLCRDTGLGANAYSIIEGRMIDAILSDRAEERRGLFEEAAGIGKYKDRRKAALRRLERAELDLERVDDVIAEVQTKVRSLARQKGKAERFVELRTRRLAVEMAVVRLERAALEGRLAAVRKGLEGGRTTGEGLRAELSTAEAESESLRIRRVDVERERGSAAAELDQVRGELARWERELAVAGERASHAGRRLHQIAVEREEVAERLADSQEGLRELVGVKEGVEVAAAVAAAAVAGAREHTGESRRRLQEAREGADRTVARENDLARRSAHLAGEVEGGEAQKGELERRLAHLRQELEAAARTLSEMAAQGDLFSQRVALLDEGVAEAAAGVQGGEGRLAEARARVERARAVERTTGDRTSRVAARRGALEALERDREGVEPVVKAALLMDDPGVVGTLGDFLAVTGGDAPAVERFLGGLLRALVVRDSPAALRVATWFREGWGKGGGLTLLPLDRVPSASGALPRGVEAAGEGAPWVRALLTGVRWVDGESSLLEGEGIRLAPSGSWVDGLGVVRVGNPGGASGILERREELARLRAEEAEATAAAEAARRELEEASAALREVEEELDRARHALRVAEDRRRETRSEVQAQVDQQLRLDRHREELTRQIEAARAAGLRTAERVQAARDELEGMAAEAEELSRERAAAARALEEVQEQWEAARVEESRLAVEEARLSGEVHRIVEREGELGRQLHRDRGKWDALAREEEELRRTLEESGSVRDEGEGATQHLFARRSKAEETLRARDARLAEVGEAVAAAEARVRRARNQEREASEEGHRLELEERELSGRLERVRERVEAEWGATLEELLGRAEPLEGEEAALRAELAEVVKGLAAIGPVNMLAVEEHQEESARLEFLTGQREDLQKARDDLRRAIREINQTATRQFNETFQRIRENFRETFQRLFQGGEADLWLADPDDPLESPVEIHASPVGKKTQRIDLLSGGERALTALSLLFGIYLVKPSPFCVLDEVDAPLDENNIGRFIRLMQEFKAGTQFVVITHNPRTIEAADWIYGVTMEEPGVSNIVGVRLEEALQTAGLAP